MRKILIFLIVCIVCTGCKNYQADIDDYLSYWSAEAYITDATVKSVVQNDADGISSVPSAEDVSVTFRLQNPKSFPLNMSAGVDPQLNVIVFDHLKTAPVIDTDYTLTQSEDMQSLILTYKASFLQAHEWGEQNLSSTLTLYAKDGRKFKQTYIFKIKANTPPPNLAYRAIGKTVVPDADGKYYYVLFLEAKGMDTSINGSALLHRDIAHLAIAEGNGEYVQVPLKVKEDKSGFDINDAAGRLLEAGDAVPLGASDIESGAGMSDTLPATNEKWIVRVKTDVPVKGAVKQYRFRLRDKAGLSSADELKASTSTNKVNPVDVTAQSGNWIITPKSGTEADPHTITYQYGVEKILLQAATATAGAAVHYKVERNGAAVSENSGTTPVTLELPASPDAVYKLTVWAVKDGFDNSSETHIFYKTKRFNELEITGGAGAWARLKNAVSVIENDDVIFINGTIQATADSDNNGAIEITKKITIKGRNNNADTDILDANKDGLPGGAVHRLFTVQSGGELILENLTLKNGKAADVNEGGSGGAILIKGSGSVILSACAIRDCEAALPGGAVMITAPDVTKQVLTVSRSKIIGNKTTTGNGYGGAFSIEGGKTVITDTVIAGNRSEQSGGAFYLSGNTTELTVIGGYIGVAGTGTSGNSAAKNGGGIFVYQGSCTLNGVTVQGNTITMGSIINKGSGIYLAKPPSGNAALTVTGATKIGSSTDTNTVCVGHLGQSAFVTAQALDSAHINIEPQNYNGQKNTTLVKVTGNSAAAYKDSFHLTSVPTGETWRLSPNSGDDGLILKKATVINHSDPNAWEKLKEAVSSATNDDIIVVDGTIRATNAPGNNGAIAVSKNLTIRGKSGAATDILDANKTTGGKTAHRIFKVTGSGTTLTLENLTLKGGLAKGSDTAGQGGALHIEGAGASIKNCTITDNEATDGGGICLKESSGMTLTNCTITHNKVTNGHGGGIFFDTGTYSSEYTITGGEISNNKITMDNPVKTYSGGGIAVGNSVVKLTLDGCTITQNTIEGVSTKKPRGAGVWLGNKAECTVKGSTRIQDNKTRNSSDPDSPIGSGGGIQLEGGTLTLESDTVISGNHAEQGKGIYVSVGQPLMFKISGNARVDKNNDVYLQTGRMITVDGALSNNPAACITVPDENYQPTTQVLTGSAVGSEHGKFTVTPKGAQNWEVDNNGKLKQKP